ncbi:MAG: transposase [Holosporaceae bacterium]|nr:transposase [Holosporaceae bacterium]
MVYSKDLREKVMEYIDQYYPQSYVAKLFNISTKTVWNWIKLRKDTGSLKPKSSTRGAVKLKEDELRQYLKDHPHVCLREIALHFNCRPSSVHSRLNHLGIKYKRKHTSWRRKSKRNALLKNVA